KALQGLFAHRQGVAGTVSDIEDARGAVLAEHVKASRLNGPQKPPVVETPLVLVTGHKLIARFGRRDSPVGIRSELVVAGGNVGIAGIGRAEKQRNQGGRQRRVATRHRTRRGQRTAARGGAVVPGGSVRVPLAVKCALL